MNNPILDEKSWYDVVRGGGSRLDAGRTRVSFRLRNDPTYHFSGLGFRIVRNA